MNLVVGSGPSGVAAASALLDAGQAVAMLDIGRECEPERTARGARLSERAPEAWSKDEVERLRGEPDADGPARKRVFGSSYPYLSPREAGLIQTGANCLVSGAKGGLTSVWGASVLPFPEDELGEWPFPAADLRPHYASAAGLLGIAGAADDLSSLFPFHVPPQPALKPSLQARAVLTHFSAHGAVLKSSGFVFGRARHAARADNCHDAALCLTGCPYGAIWNAAEAVERLKSRPSFRYEGGVCVLRIEEKSAGGVRLHAARAGASRTAYDGERVFLACGPLATARLICGSFGAPAEGLPLLSQPYFVLPLLLNYGVPGAPETRLHTLAQIFLELKDLEVSRRLVHLQIYGHNEVIADRLDAVACWAGPLARSVKRRFAPRLLAIQGYLHSDEAIPVRVSADGRGEDCRLVIRAGSAAATKAAIRRVVDKLSRHTDALGFKPLSLLMTIGLPGEGNHVGGLFPMKSEPGPWQTDRRGRLHGRKRVHLVDSSILPTLPASTFTYAVMANAGRIAAEAAQEAA